MALLQISDFNNASTDLKFIDSIETSANDTETSREGFVSDTKIGRIGKIGFEEAATGAAWAAGVDFTSYMQYLVYNDEVYIPISSAALPLTSGATPDSNFRSINTVFDIVDAIDQYNQTNLSKFTDYVFADQTNLAALTTLAGEVVTVNEGDSLTIFNESGSSIAYIAIDAADIEAGDVTILLANGLYAKQISYALDPTSQNPIANLDESFDAMKKRRAVYEFSTAPTGLGDQCTAIGEDGKVYYKNQLWNTTPTIIGYDSKTESYIEHVLSPTDSLSDKGLATCADGKLYIGPTATSHGYIGALDIYTGEYTEIAVTHTGNSKTYDADYAPGAITTDDGMIYWFCNGSSQTGVLKLDTNTQTATFTDYGLLLTPDTGSGGFCAGCLAPNGNIYLIPYSPAGALEVVIFDTSTETFSSFGSVATSNSRPFCSMHVGPDGFLYAAPYSYDYFMRIDSANDLIDDDQWFEIPELTAGGNIIRHGCFGGNGNYYAGTASTTNEFVEVDLISKKYKLFGDIPGTFYSFSVDKNGIIVVVGSANPVLIKNINNDQKWTQSTYIART